MHLRLRAPHLSPVFPLAISILVCQYVDMVCPFCAHDSKVTNSRLQKRLNSVWRRRECLRCHAVWTTTERIESATAYKVSRRGKLDYFKPELLLISIYETLKHRSSAAQDAQYISVTVLRQLQSKQRAVITISDIRKTTHDVLVRFDTLSADLYAATHNMREE